MLNNSLKIGLVLLFLLGFTAVGLAQTKKPKVKTYGSSLFVKVKGHSKEQISQKTYDWITETLDKSQFSPRNMDLEEGAFMGVGSYVDSVGIVQFDMSAYARKNGVQLVFDADFHKQNPKTNAKLNDNRLRKNAQKHFQNLANDLEKYFAKKQ